MSEASGELPVEDAVIATRRARIVDAAAEVFGRYGYRKMTMEAAAEAAQIAKATLYSYYRNKEALFEAVARNMATRLVDGFMEDLAAPGPVEERAANALVHKNLVIFQSVRSLPHGLELLSAKGRLAGSLFDDADRAMIQAIGDLLGSKRFYGDRAQQLARGLFYGSHGIAEQCASASATEAEIREFVNIYLAGVRARAR